MGNKKEHGHLQNWITHEEKDDAFLQAKKKHGTTKRPSNYYVEKISNF